MDRHGIPTATWSCHTTEDSAHASVTGKCVVKADGLAGGKGVTVCQTGDAAHKAIKEAFSGRFGTAGNRVIIEELLEGPEVSIIALCDGEVAIPMLPCRDHKRRYDGDTGPNTGGMGAICPVPGVTRELVEEIQRVVLQPTVDGMRAEGAPFRGALYAGIMLTPNGPKVLEYNVRFGDPECQPLMVMLNEDIVPLLMAAGGGSLAGHDITWATGACCCVVMVSDGYPGPITKGRAIFGEEELANNGQVFYAGADRTETEIVTSGGRVLSVIGTGPDAAAAKTAAYRSLARVSFEGAAWRKDIGGLE